MYNPLLSYKISYHVPDMIGAKSLLDRSLFQILIILQSKLGEFVPFVPLENMYFCLSLTPMSAVWVIFSVLPVPLSVCPPVCEFKQS